MSEIFSLKGFLLFFLYMIVAYSKNKSHKKNDYDKSNCKSKKSYQNAPIVFKYQIENEAKYYNSYYA